MQRDSTTEERRSLTKIMTQQQVEIKKRARKIFGAGTKSNKKYNAGHGTRSRSKSKFLLGR